MLPQAPAICQYLQLRATAIKGLERVESKFPKTATKAHISQSNQIQDNLRFIEALIGLD